MKMSWVKRMETVLDGRFYAAASGALDPQLDMADAEQTHQELVKCVVVGDTAVGKTRLICARACNMNVSLFQLLNTHVPTVWAIDQYRMYRDVLERSCKVVDGVNVSIRLWDTFGDHEKDRKFAYGKSDVVLLCFSIANRISLRNCKTVWYPEIRNFCPNTPIVLVGCKSDLRYMYRDEAYLGYFRERSPFMRPVGKNDLIMPDEAKSLANELGMYYYETSVLTRYGVNEVFENAIRAALIARRSQSFWMTNLKKVQRPLLQAPYCPPKPTTRAVQIVGSNYEDHLSWLHQTKYNADVILLVDNVAFEAHKCVLSVVSNIFCQLFVGDTVADLARSTSEYSLVSCTNGSSPEDTTGDAVQAKRKEKRMKLRKSRRRSSNYVLLSARFHKDLDNPDYYEELNHSIFLSIKNRRCDDVSGSIQTIITISNLISPAAMSECLSFIYTGKLINANTNTNQLLDVKQAAQFLALQHFVDYIENVQTGRPHRNADIAIKQNQMIQNKLYTLCLQKCLFSDVLLKLDDGFVAAHKAILCARCDVMKAMFSGDFKEKNSKTVLFPGVRLDVFYEVLHFIYTDTVSHISIDMCTDILELSNRLCLPRLMTLVEKEITEELVKLSTAPDGAHSACLKLLEPAKMHNANCLADWCMNYLCINYDRLCQIQPKLLKSLSPEHEEYVTEHRWPPVWYVKEHDTYLKNSRERQREEKLLKKRQTCSIKRCLCLSIEHDEKSNSECPDFTAASNRVR